MSRVTVAFIGHPLGMTALSDMTGWPFSSTEIVVCARVREAIEDADIIVTATSSFTTEYCKGSV